MLVPLGPVSISQMGKGRDWEHSSIINELTQGMELVNQLKQHLDPSTSHEACEFLVEKILSSYDKALSMLKWSAFLEQPRPAMGSDRDCKDQRHKDVSKKRKTLPQWTEQVRVCSGTPPDDGYSWRKYGQKDIMGANFPRAYYRCTHRDVQGCLATKQVQRSDEDQSVFEISYRGRHTCVHLNPALASSERKWRQDHHQQLLQEQSQEVLLNSGIKTEDLSTREEIFPSCSFPCMPIESENVDNDIFPDSIKESSFLGSYSPPLRLLMNPTTSRCHRAR